MKKLFVIILTLSIGGCASNGFISKVNEAVTTGIANPVGISELYNIEAAYGVALSAAVAYRERPRCTKTSLESATNFCARRSIVIKLQNADLQAQNALNKARAFINNNPTLDASSFIQAAKLAVDIFKGTI